MTTWSRSLERPLILAVLRIKLATELLQSSWKPPDSSNEHQCERYFNYLSLKFNSRFSACTQTHLTSGVLSYTVKVMHYYSICKHQMLSCHFKGILHPNMKILSSFTHPQVVANLYELLSSAEHKGRYFKE